MLQYFCSLIEGLYFLKIIGYLIKVLGSLKNLGKYIN